MTPGPLEERRWKESPFPFSPNRGRRCPFPNWPRPCKRLGFDGIELPVRPGFQVEPETIAKQLPIAARQMADAGVKICSVAGNTDEATIAACAEAGVPVIRTMAQIPDGMNYLEAVAAIQHTYDSLLPALERYDVTIGVQNHFGHFVPNAHALLQLIEKYDAQPCRRSVGCGARSACRRPAPTRARCALAAPVHGQPQERLLRAHQWAGS